MMNKNLSEMNPDKILIRSTNWIGDAVMTTPAVRTIRENFPDAHISILVHPWVADVFQASPHVDEIIYYNKKTSHKGLSGLLRLGRELAKRDFDMALILQNAFEAAFLTRLAHIPLRAGYNRDCRGLLLTHSVPLRKEIKEAHQIHYYQSLLKNLGLTCGSNELFLHVSERDRNWADNFLKTPKGEGPTIGLNPGAAYGPAKRWPAEKYGELAAKLINEVNATIVIFGTEADRKASQTIKQWAGGQIVDLCGETSLSQAIAYIDACACFITNDSGLMHVAAALKTPLVAIFGSTDHIATGPFSKNAVVVRKEMPCSPCLKTHCDRDFACMMRIGVDDVFPEVIRLLKNNVTIQVGYENNNNP